LKTEVRRNGICEICEICGNAFESDLKTEIRDFIGVETNFIASPSRVCPYSLFKKSNLEIPKAQEKYLRQICEISEICGKPFSRTGETSASIR